VSAPGAGPAAPPAVGVVGVGSLGFHHARLYAASPLARLVGVYDTRAERGAEVAAQLGTTAFPSLDALLAEAEAVSVVVPTPAHHEVGMAVLGRGRHLLMEKPLAATIAQAEALVARAAERGVVLQTGHVERFNRAIRAAAPHLGRPLFIESDRVAPFGVRGSDVAVILDLMIHDIDLVLGLVREPVREIRASGIGVLTPSVDIATARIEFASGAIANLTASRLARERVRRLRIFQASGYMSLDLAAGSGDYLRLKPGAAEALAAGKAAPGGAAGAGPPDLATVVETIALTAPEAEPLALEIENFIRSVRGQEAPAASGVDGLEALRVAFSVLDAMRPRPRTA
jgi:predicted dehydrogenase